MKIYKKQGGVSSMKHFSKWGIAPIAFCGALLLGLLLVACPTASPGAGPAAATSCEATTDSSAANILILYGDVNWAGYEDTDCSHVAYASTARGVSSAAGDGSDITITDIDSSTDGCAVGASCIRSAYTGAWGGFFYTFMGAQDIAAAGYSHIHFSYRFAATATPLLRVVLEDASGDTMPVITDESSGGEAQELIDLTGSSAPSITADGMWQTAVVPLADLNGTFDDDEITNVGFWNQGTNVVVEIDEVYLSDSATALTASP